MIHDKAKTKKTLKTGFIIVLMLILTQTINADWVKPQLTTTQLDQIYCKIGGNCTINTLNITITNINVTNTSKLSIDSFKDSTILYINKSYVDTDNDLKWNYQQKQLEINGSLKTWNGTKIGIIYNSTTRDIGFFANPPLSHPQFGTNNIVNLDHGLMTFSSNVNHGMTTEMPTNVYSKIGEYSTNSGGFVNVGASGSASVPGMYFVGIIGNTNPTDTVPAVKFIGGRKSGTSYTTLASSETAFQFLNSATAIMTLLGNGNMGLGTTTPTGKLHLKGTGPVPLYIESTDNTIASYASNNWVTTGSQFQLVAHAGARTASRYGLTLGGWAEIGAEDGTSTATNGMVIGVYPAKPLVFGTNNAERMRIEGDGDVGIGTLTPTTRLEVKDGSGITISATGTSNVVTITNGFITFPSSAGYGARWGGGNTRLVATPTATDATGYFDFYMGNDRIFLLTGASSTINYFEMLSSNTTKPLELKAVGTDTNISIDITPKGAGILNVSGIITGEPVFGEIWIEGTDIITNNFTVKPGTILAGNLTNITTIDMTYLQVAEVVGTPGFNITYNFTANGNEPASFEWVGYYYPCNPAHIINVNAWNGTAYETIGASAIPCASSANNMEVSVNFPSNSSRFINNGMIRTQLYHSTSGNTNHRIFTDYVKIQPKDMTFTLAGTYYQAGGGTEGISQYVTTDATNANFTIQYDGIYKVCVSASFSGTANSTIHGDLFVNGAEVDKIAFTRKLGSNGDVGSANMCGLYNASVNDVMDLRFKSDSSGGWVHFENGNFNIQRLN